MRTTEAYDNLTRKASYNSTIVQLLLRELAHADANAQAARLDAELQSRSCAVRSRTPSACPQMATPRSKRPHAASLMGAEHAMSWTALALRGASSRRGV